MSNLELITNKDTDNSQDKMHFETFKDLMMYFQTSIRNVALTTTVSFAALGYSRFYRGKNQLYVSGMVLVSLLLLRPSLCNPLFILPSSLHCISLICRSPPVTPLCLNWSSVSFHLSIVSSFHITKFLSR